MVKMRLERRGSSLLRGRDSAGLIQMMIRVYVIACCSMDLMILSSVAIVTVAADATMTVLIEMVRCQISGHVLRIAI